MFNIAITDTFVECHVSLIPESIFGTQNTFGGSLKKLSLCQYGTAGNVQHRIRNGGDGEEVPIVSVTTTVTRPRGL